MDKPAVTPSAGYRALVVDDEVPLAEVVASYLRREQFDVSLAHSGADALAQAREIDPDVVILDLALPGIDGVEVCRQLRTFSDAYVVMLTARDTEMDTIVGLSVGADDYVTKPFSPRELVARIRAMLRRPRTVAAPTSAAAAAYARRGGMRAFVLIPDGYVAQGKLAQALVYGAEVLAIRGNFDRALDIVQEAAGKYPVTLVNSVNPFRLQGQKTAAFEIIDALGDAPDWLCIPMGNAGNISAYWMGFQEYQQAGHSRTLPRMMGFQASGSAPLVNDTTVSDPDTIATAIRIGNPVNRAKAIAARQASKGAFLDVTDAEIIEAYKLLGGQEGIFCEPASAASVAGLLKRKDEVPANATVVCVLTGNGLKDPDCAISNNDAAFHTDLDPDLSTVAGVMGF